MNYYDDVAIETLKKNNSNQLKISDHPYKTLIIGGSGSGKINALLNLMEKIR